MQAALPRSSNKQTFFFDSRDTHVFNALVEQGWTPVSRGAVFLKYTASDVGNSGHSRTFAIGNHLRFTRAITNKEGLGKALGSFTRLTKISTDDFFPRQFSEISDLHALYSRYTAYLHWWRRETLQGSQFLREITDPVLDKWLSEICPEISSFSSLTRALRALEAADSQLSLLEEISDPVFVVKPGASSRGSGVFFSDHWEEISAQIILNTENVYMVGKPGKIEAHVDFLLRKFEYRKIGHMLIAADAGMTFLQSLAAVDELMQREALHAAVKELGNEQMQQALDWATRALTAHPEHTTLVTAFVQAVCEENGVLLRSPTLAGTLKKLRQRTEQEITLIHKLTPLIGTLQTLMLA